MTIKNVSKKGVTTVTDMEKPEIKKEESFKGVNYVKRKSKKRTGKRPVTDI